MRHRWATALPPMFGSHYWSILYMETAEVCDLAEDAESVCFHLSCWDKNSVGKAVSAAYDHTTAGTQ